MNSLLETGKCAAIRLPDENRHLPAAWARGASDTVSRPLLDQPIVQSVAVQIRAPRRRTRGLTTKLVAAIDKLLRVGRNRWRWTRRARCEGRRKNRNRQSASN